jgi:integrase
VLRIIGKGNKERCVPLPEPMLAKLRRLRSTHRNPRWLTPDRSGTGPVSKNALWRTFRLAVRVAGIKRPVNPHGLRHSR